MKVEILEIDQWTSTGNVKAFSWTELKKHGIDCITGGDSETIRIVSGGTFLFRQVNETEVPRIGNIWMIENEKGYPTIWKTQYDSSG
jgi:hypothetical protein